MRWVYSGMPDKARELTRLQIVRYLPFRFCVQLWVFDKLNRLMSDYEVTLVNDNSMCLIFSTFIHILIHPQCTFSAQNSRREYS